jgi:hypothetical protein
MNAPAGFKERRLGVICCGHVFRRERPAKLVCHEKGDWQFMCGGTDHSSADGHFVHVGVLLNLDPSLDQLADLPPGWEAERDDSGAPWIITRYGAGDG